MKPTPQPPPLEFERLLFPLKVRCGIADCLMTRGPIQRPPVAAWQEKYTKIPICDRDKVRLESTYAGESFLAPPQSWPKLASAEEAPRGEGRVARACPLRGTEFCPTDCVNRGVCPAYEMEDGRGGQG